MPAVSRLATREHAPAGSDHDVDEGEFAEAEGLEFGVEAVDELDKMTEPKPEPVVLNACKVANARCHLPVRTLRGCRIGRR